MPVVPSADGRHAGPDTTVQFERLTVDTGPAPTGPTSEGRRPARAPRGSTTESVRHHRRPSRTIRAVGVFVLVLGAVAGVYLGVSRYQSRGNGVDLAVDSGPVAQAAVDPVRQEALDKAQERAAAAAVDAAARAKRAAEVAKRQAQEAAASRSEARPKYPVPTSCKEYSGNRAIGCALLLDAGFKLDQMPCLEKLWTKESGWNPKASNGGSGAYGIPQALPGEKMAEYGSDWRTNPVPQIKWGLNYIKNRYHDPCGAWAHFLDQNWY